MKGPCEGDIGSTGIDIDADTDIDSGMALVLEGLQGLLLREIGFL